jgi:uncharacterized protein (DUF169 family)
MDTQRNWEQIVDTLTKLMRIKQTPVGMKFCETEEELQAISKIRISDKRFSVCQMIGQSVEFQWTVGILAKNPHADYCRCINGLSECDQRFHSGEMLAGIWFKDREGSSMHNQSLLCVPPKYAAIAVSPLSSNRIPEPDVCLIYATPGQMFLMLSGLIYDAYQKLDFTFVGESTCSDSWVRTFVTGKPSLSIPCFAERKFGGVGDDELLLALTPDQMEQMVKGVKNLSANGLRYPIAPYSLSTDIMDGLPQRYFNF